MKTILVVIVYGIFFFFFFNDPACSHRNYFLRLFKNFSNQPDKSLSSGHLSVLGVFYFLSTKVLRRIVTSIGKTGNIFVDYFYISFHLRSGRFVYHKRCNLGKQFLFVVSYMSAPDITIKFYDTLKVITGHMLLLFPSFLALKWDTSTWVTCLMLIIMYLLITRQLRLGNNSWWLTDKLDKGIPFETEN